MLTKGLYSSSPGLGPREDGVGTGDMALDMLLVCLGCLTVLGVLDVDIALFLSANVAFFDF